MGLWTWGETTAGTLIACLPIMPKFFQHVVSQAYGTLSSISKSKSKVNSASSIVKNRQEIPKKLKTPFDKYKGGISISETWSNSGTQQDSCKGDYVTLDEFEMVISENNVNGQRRATLREDLESGHHNP